MVSRLFATILVALSAFSTSAAQEAERIFASSERAVFTIDTPKKVGTGFVLSNGLLVTCYHVVKGVGGRIKLREAPSTRLTYLAHDEKADIAVFSLRSTMPAYLRLADAAPKVGATAYVIGTPLGALERSISNGIISQVRKIKGLEFLQVTAAVSPGSSGSPVLDLKGRVIGMVTGTLEEGQANNFAVSTREIARFLTTVKRKDSSSPAIAVASKIPKVVGQTLVCQVVRATALYRATNKNAEPVMYIRAKRLTRAQRTVAAEWVAIELTSGQTLYVPAKDVRLFEPKDKGISKLSDPLDVAPPKGFEKLISDLHFGVGTSSSFARSQLLSYGPAIVKHILARFEHEWNYEAYSALLSLSDLGVAAKSDLIVFLKDGSETQKKAIASLLVHVVERLREAERISSDAPGSVARDEFDRQLSAQTVKTLSWLRDDDLVWHYSALLSANQARADGLKIVAALRLKRYESEITSYKYGFVKKMESNDFNEALSGYEEYCLLADDSDTRLLKSQFERITAKNPRKNELGWDLNAATLIDYLASGMNKACYQILLDLLDHENELARREACRGLRRFGPKEETMSRMSPLLKDQSNFVREQALVTLCDMAPHRFVEEAVSLVKSFDPWKRAMAARALGETGIERIVIYLELLAQDDVEVVRQAARDGLSIHHTPAAVKVLTRLLDSADPKARKDARSALKSIGKEPPPESD